MKTEHTWGWPIAGYLFLGGLGAGMIVVSTASDLFFDSGIIFMPGDFAAAVLIALGSSLLILELGRPFQFWRVFSRQKAISTFGAWMLSLLMVVSIVHGSLWLPFLPWHSLTLWRSAVAWIGLLAGLAVAIYTGAFLGSLKARPFWNGPALPVLFLLSALATGIAGQHLVASFWPMGDRSAVIAAGRLLATINIGLLVLQVIVVMVYVLSMRGSNMPPSVRAATMWLRGGAVLPFWVGLFGIGLVFPLALYALGIAVASIVASIFVLFGGLVLRFLVVYANYRAPLPGEETLLSRLPKGDERFLHAWEDDSE